MNKKIYILATIVIIIFIIYKAFGTIKIEYEDSLNYKITITKITKSLNIETIKYCDVLESCTNEISKNKISLTSEEYKKIKNILRQKNYNKKHLVNALDTLAKNEKIMFKNGEEFYDLKEDLNKDGIITYREYGNIYLNNLILD